LEFPKQEFYFRITSRDANRLYTMRI